jgi:hypothetical protein
MVSRNKLVSQWLVCRKGCSVSETKLQTAESLKQRPFAERQLLVVSTTAVLKAAEKFDVETAETSTKKGQASDWSGMALHALRGHFGINAERLRQGVGWPGQI